MAESPNQTRRALSAPPHAGPRPPTPLQTRPPVSTQVRNTASVLPVFTEMPAQAPRRPPIPTQGTRMTPALPVPTSSTTLPARPTPPSRPAAPQPPLPPRPAPMRPASASLPHKLAPMLAGPVAIPVTKPTAHLSIPDPVLADSADDDDDEELVELTLQPLSELHSVEGNAVVEDSEIQRLLDTGVGEAEVACHLNVTLARVFEVHKTSVLRRVADSETNKRALATSENGHTVMPPPREVFAERIQDFSEVLDVAKQEYLNDPDSETNYNAMSSFMKTMKDLFQAYQDLEDPQDVAEQIIKQIVVPFMNALIKINIESFKTIMEDVAPAMANDFQKQQLNDGLKDALKHLRETTRTEYNRAVKTTASVFEVNLDNMLLKLQPVSGDFD